MYIARNVVVVVVVVVVPPCRRMLSRCVHLTARKSPYTGARGADYKSDEKSSGSCARGTRANCSVSLPPSLRAYNDGARGVVAEERNAVQLQASGGPPRRYRSCRRRRCRRRRRRCCRLTSDDLSDIRWFSASRQSTPDAHRRARGVSESRSTNCIPPPAHGLTSNACRQRLARRSVAE